MGKRLSIAAVVVLCLALIIGIACGEEEEEGVKGLKFGIGLPLTGLLGSVVGIPAKSGFSLVAEDIGEFTVGGEQYRWNLIFEDNLFTTAGGVASASKLIFEHNVKFMHQSCPAPAMASMEMAQEAGILLDVSSVRADALTPDRPNVFQVAATFEVHLPSFFDWLTKERPEVKRITVCTSDDVSGYTIADVATACCEHYGLEIVCDHYALGTVEFYPIATRIMTTDPDLFIGDPRIYLAMAEMGYEGTCLSHLFMPSLADAEGWDLFQGFLVYMPQPFGGIWPEVDAFAEEFEDRYGTELSTAPLFAANVLYVFTDALRQAGTVDDIDKIIATMETGTFDTLFGPFTFGGEVLNDVGHIGICTSPIYEVVGSYKYRVQAVYTPEETEALMSEVFK